MGDVLIFRPPRRLSPDLLTGSRPIPTFPLPDPSEAFEAYCTALKIWQATGIKTAEAALRQSYWTFEYAFSGAEEREGER